MVTSHIFTVHVRMHVTEHTFVNENTCTICNVCGYVTSCIYLVNQILCSLTEDGRKGDTERKEARHQETAGTTPAELVDEDEIVKEVHIRRGGTTKLFRPDGSVKTSLCTYADVIQKGV